MNENITAAHDDLNFKDQRALKVTDIKNYIMFITVYIPLDHRRAASSWPEH